MARKQQINSLIQGVSVFALIFTLSFFSQKFLVAGNIFQATLYSGKSTDIINPSLQCSINDRYLLPIHGGSDSYKVSIDKPSYGNLYASDCKTAIDLDNVTPANSPLCFQANIGIMGTANIIAQDKLAAKSPVNIPVNIGPPCVKSINLCKNLINADTCEEFTDQDKTMLVGSSIAIPYAKLTLVNNEELFVPSNSPQIKFSLSKQILNSPYIINSNANSTKQEQISGIITNSIFYPSAMGNVVLQVQLLNTKSFKGNAEFYSEPLLINVTGANCATSNNDIFANSRSLIVSSADLTKLPTAAFVVYEHDKNYPFTIAGTDLAGISYNFLFQHDGDLSTPKDYKEEIIERVNSSTAKYYTINYIGDDTEMQIDSIMRTFDKINSNYQALILSKYDTNQIMFKTKNIGTGDTGNKNIWTINTSATAQFGSAVSKQLNNIINGQNAVSGQGAFANVMDNLIPFPDTLNEGDLMVAYYPGSNLHGFWTAINSVSTFSTDDKTMSIKIIPYATTISNSGEAGQVLILEQERLKIAETDKKDAKTAYDKAQTDYTTAATALTKTLTAEEKTKATATLETAKTALKTAQDAYDKAVDNYAKAIQNVSAAKEKQISETVEGSQRYQTLSNYDSPFAVINAQKAGQAMVAVQGFSCSASKKITVIPSAIEILVNNKLPIDDIVNVKANELLNLSARYKANGQIVNESLIEWQLVDDSAGGNNQVATMLSAITEIKTDSSGSGSSKSTSASASTTISANTSTLKALHKGIVHVRAIINIPAVDNTPAQKLQSKVLKVEVAGGMAVNNMAYNHTVTLFPNEVKNFIITGLESSATKFEWITHDMKTANHGVFTLGNYMYSNDKLIYTAPTNLDAKELADILEVKNLDTNELITINIKIIPAKITELQILPVTATTSTSPSIFKLKLGQSLPLKLVALLEDGTKQNWQAGEMTSPVFGNPTWTIGDTTVASVTASGQIIVEPGKSKVGFTTVEVAVSSEYKDEKGTVISTKTKAYANIEVQEGFSINGLYDIEQFKNFEVPVGTNFEFKATDNGAPINVKWNLEKNQSGASISATSGDTITYHAGVKSDASGSIKDIIKVTDGEGNIYSLEIMVISPVLEKLFLTRVAPVPTSTPYKILREGDILDKRDLVLNYKLANYPASSVILGTDDLPVVLGSLTWESSDDNLATVSNGIVTLKKEGKVTITVYSSLNSELKTSLTLDIEAKQAQFVPNSTKISPVFTTADALLHLETEIYFEDGIKNIQEVTISFNSPYLQSRKLKLDEVYWQEILTREGIKAKAEEKAPATPDASSTEETGPRQARYILDYQLPGNKSLDGKTIIYTITVTTNRGVRAEDNSTNTTITADPSLLKNQISQVGQLDIGTAESMCTKNKRLKCLLRGLKCLKTKETGVITEECDQIISVFTNDPANFSIMDVLKKYKTLK